MRVRHLLIGALAFATAAGAVGLVLATCDERTESPRVRPTAEESRTAVDRAAPSPPSADRPPTKPRLGGATEKRPEVIIDREARDLDDVPTLAQLDKQHPGLAAAYQVAADDWMAASGARQLRRCFRKYREQHASIEWSGVQTFTVDAHGRARLSGAELVPGTSETRPFLECISQDLLGKVEFQVPGGTPASFVVRNEGSHIGRADLNPDEIKSEVVALSERAADPNLSAAKRALLEQQLALWRCYSERGLAARDQCQREIDGD
jgi:hypothetical protein